MSILRDLAGRFIEKPLEALSPAYRRRKERAQSRGLSLKAARGHGTPQASFTDSEKRFGSDYYERSLYGLGLMREGRSLTAAAKEAEITPEALRRNVGEALERDGNRYRARARDRLYRRMQFVTERGYVGVEPADSVQASKLSRYHVALARYLEQGNEQPLRKFARMRLRLRDRTSLGFITDLEAIDRLAAAGVLSFTSIYRYAT